MSRSGYNDDNEGCWGLWRGAVQSATFGKRGQAFLKELADALDAMPDKRLIANELEQEGSYCTLGAVGAARGMDLKAIDYEDAWSVAKSFGIAMALAAEIEYMNDEGHIGPETPEQCWLRMRQWVANQLPKEQAS